METVLRELKKITHSAKGRTLLLGWGAAILFFGQLGIIGSVLASINDTGFKILILNLKLGNFYTFAIACLATDFMNFIQDYILDKSIEDESIKDIKTKISIVEVVLIVLITLLCFTSKINLSMTFQEFIDSTTVFEGIVQLLLYIFSISIALVSFCLNFSDIKFKSYAQKDNETREQYTNTDNINNDGGGIAI